MKIDLENIKYASGSSNPFSSDLSDLESTVKVNQFINSDAKSYFNISPPILYRLKFNPNGITLPTNLRISIPVTIEHRWGITQDNLIIKVN